MADSTCFFETFAVQKLCKEVAVMPSDDIQISRIGRLGRERDKPALESHQETDLDSVVEAGSRLMGFGCLPEQNFLFTKIL